MILLDTHALLWWALDPDQLSAPAKAACEGMEVEGGFASSVSIWELGIKLQRGKLELGIALDDFVRRIDQSGIVELLPVTTSVWLRALALPWSHRDPADRIIAATALMRDVPILTKDLALHRFAEVLCIW